jgi:helicase
MTKQKVEQEYKTDVLNVAFDTLKKDKQALVFLNTKRSAEKCAEDIALKNKKEEFIWSQISHDVARALARPTKQCERLARCVKKGIAFHHAGLAPKQREIIEANFKKGVIKIICCTPTLAAGVDLPAYRVIIRDLKRFSDTGWGGMASIPVLEYLQMAGRAGRPKFDNVGEAIILAAKEGDKERHHETYILGEPEEIYSKLAVEPVLRTYILSLVATDFVSSRKTMIDFFSHTFWAYQYEDMYKLEKIVNKMIRKLETWGFIKTSSGGSEFVSAAQLDKDSLEATAIGKRVAELYIDPLTAHHFITCLQRSESKYLTSFGILQMMCNTIEMRPLLRVKQNELDEINERYLPYESSMLDLEPSIYEPEYDMYLNSLKTAFFMEDWISELDEEYLLEKYDIRPGETRYKVERADWLLFAASEMAKMMKKQTILKEMLKLRFRLKYGVKEELLALLKLQNIGRVRARKMYSHGIKDIEDVKKADAATLAQLLGRKVAIDVKKQVGEEVKVVPERKRKGQISLGDF